MNKNKEILVFVELMPNLDVAQVSLELGSKAVELKSQLENSKICGVIVNKELDFSEITKTLSEYGFDKVYLIKNEKAEIYSTGIYTSAICKLIEEISPHIMLFGATRLGRDLAPRISARLGYGLTADCTALEINEAGQLCATRPTFGGNLMATILSKSQTQMATVRPNVFKAIRKDLADIEVDEKTYDIMSNFNIELIKSEPFDENGETSISEAQIIVAGGYGMKNKEGFDLLYELAELIGAKVGASRKAVDSGWAKTNIQIGQTGKTVTPKIYIACGISGAIQHLVGINSSDKIIAINSDPNAPIFKNADFGIVGDVFEVLPKLIKKLKGC